MGVHKPKAAHSTPTSAMGSACSCTGSPDAWAQVEKWKRKYGEKFMGPQPEAALELVHRYCVENSKALAEAVTGWEYKGQQAHYGHVYHIRIGTVDYKSAKYTALFVDDTHAEGSVQVGYAGSAWNDVRGTLLPSQTQPSAIGVAVVALKEHGSLPEPSAPAWEPCAAKHEQSSSTR